MGDPSDQAERRPFGDDSMFDSLEATRTFARAARLTQALFGASHADVLILRPGGASAWATSPRKALSFVGPLAKAGDHPVWVEPVGANSRFARNDVVDGAPQYRFLATAPILMPGRPAVAALCVMDEAPRDLDPELAARLVDIAAILSTEFMALTALHARPPAAPPIAADGVLSAFVQASPSPVFMTDVEMRVVAFSPSWPETMDLVDGHLLGRCIYEIFPESRAAYSQVYGYCMSGAVVRAERIPLHMKDGDRIWVDAELIPWRDAKGVVGGLVVSTFPVNDVVKALADMERSQRRLDLAAKLADLHVWEMDFGRTLLETSGAESDLFDRPLSYCEVIAEPMAHVHEDDRARVAAHWDADSQRGYATPVEYRIARADGREIWVSSITEMVFEGGMASRMVGAMQNITERKLSEIEMGKAREAAENANRAKSQFLATMSHEIRTPLNGVLGMAQAMAVDELSSTQRDRLDVIHKSGETLLAILNDILDLSKIEAGKFELEEADFNLSELALGAHAAFTALANRKGLSFNLVVAETARGTYRGDSTRIRQVLYNLISNALKFTEEGSVRVDVDRDLGGLAITVADTGVGIDKDAVSSLFEKFVQADASMTRRFGGTGLGLAICREIVQLMGGEISATSDLGKGATFRVHLPLERIADECALPAPPIVTEVESEGADMPSLRILAAEDNTVNQLVLKTLLHQIGLDPVLVADGAEAVAAWEADVWDVILMDIQMPNMDGLTAARVIRAQEAATGRARTPIIALTANAMSHQAAEYLANGMDGVVSKPLEIRSLFAALQQTLEADERAA